MTSLCFETVGTSMNVLRSLYLDDGDAPFCLMEIRVPAPSLDTVDEGLLSICVRRLYDRRHAYEFTNGDRVYRTSARFRGDVAEFDVDVLIRSREADFECATIAMSPQALEIFAEFRKQLDGM